MSWWKRLTKPKREAGTEAGAYITLDDFKRIDLRLGLVKTVETIPRSDKLLKLTVDIGEERTVVAGLGKHYSPGDLIGKRVVVLANLKPTKLMGIESRGMLLAVGDDKEGLALITVDREISHGKRLV